jgi:glyoxylase-like metal-dependent hydrolase (beta-lactamase superfamily II)
MNEPVATFESSVTETKKYHNPYRAFFAPYNFFMYPLVALDAVSPYLARKAFSAIGAVPWPGPVNGSVEPRPLKEEDMENIGLGDITLRGWRVDSKIIFPTPGHSPCSISLLWPERKALFISDADWIGNPALIFASLRECISSLGKMKELTEAGLVELLLPAHGLAKDGREEILSHLDFHIGRLEVMRNEVLSAYRSCGGERDVRNVADYLTRRSPLFRMLKLTNYPRLVIFVHNIVTLCLREEGVW